MELVEAQKLLLTIFSPVKKNDVRHKAGRVNKNAGELLSASVAYIIAAIGHIKDDDVFLDIGGGLSNGAVLFVLLTKDWHCIGLQ